MPPERWCGYCLQPPLGLGDADQAEQLDGARVVLVARGAEMLLQRLGQLALDRQHGVQRGHRFLEDHADLAAAHLAHLVVGQLQHVAPADGDRALDDLAGRVGDQPQDRHGADRLAASRLADDGDRLALGDVIGNAVHRLNDARGREEVRAEIPDLDDVRQPPRPRGNGSPAPPGSCFLRVPVCFGRSLRLRRRRGSLSFLFGGDSSAAQASSKLFSSLASLRADGFLFRRALGLRAERRVIGGRAAMPTKDSRRASIDARGVATVTLSRPEKNNAYDGRDDRRFGGGAGASSPRTTGCA